MSEQKVHAVIFKDAESDQWVAICLEYQVVSQGDSEEDARAMIKEAVELYLEDVSDTELETTYQEIEGDPSIHSVLINAPSLLRR